MIGKFASSNAGGFCSSSIVWDGSKFALGLEGDAIFASDPGAIAGLEVSAGTP